MFVPEKLYQVSARDGGTGPRGFRVNVKPAAAASVQLATNFTNTLGMIYAIQTVAFAATPGAGQIWLRGTLFTLDTGGGVNSFIAGDSTPSTAAQTIRRMFYPQQFFLWPGEVMRYLAQFDAGGVSNDTDCWVSGLLIPLGSFVAP